MKINILTCNMPWKRGKNDFYPLLKWRKEFKKEGIEFSFLSNHMSQKLWACEILIVDFRYFQQIIKGNYSPSGFTSQNIDFIKELLIESKKRGIKTVRFDSDDGVFLTFPDLFPYFDVIIKKQILKNLDSYLKVEDQTSAVSWRPHDKTMFYWKNLGTTNKKDLKKLKIGWNIGLCDYRTFPGLINKYSPIGSQAIFPGCYKKVRFDVPSSERDLFFTYRGGVGKTMVYNYHRKAMLKVIEEMKGRDGIRVGGKVSKKSYMGELKNSKVALSPFGWGEVCYRDFEAIIAGALLVKPRMDHLRTYPDIYIEDKTYIPVEWDFKDLRITLEKISQNYEQYMSIIENAQSILKKHISSSNLFIDHFKNVVIDGVIISQNF